jgi:hypothetical protein
VNRLGGRCDDVEARELLRDERTRSALARITGVDLDAITSYAYADVSGAGGATAPSRLDARSGGGVGRPSPLPDEQAFDEVYRAFAELDGGPAPSLDEQPTESDEDRFYRLAFEGR